MKRFIDNGDTIFLLYDSVIVGCPKCGKPTDFASNRINCFRCGYSKEFQEEAPKYPTSVGNKDLSLFLTANCCGETLWASNLAHLEFIESYVESDLRERTPNVNKSLASRLPKWIKNSKNRTAILKVIAKMKKGLIEDGYQPINRANLRFKGFDYPLRSNGKLSYKAKALGLKTWHQLLEYVQALPYGRNRNRKELGLVLTEQKGTCSSKHALLKSIAQENWIPCVSLVLGLYKMNAQNTPGIGKELKENKLEYIPEAHCYLRVNGHVVDLTATNSKFELIAPDLLLEQEIQPNQVTKFKVDFHQQYLKKWLEAEGDKFSLDEIWKIREACIASLEQTQK